MQAFELDELIVEAKAIGKAYLEFLRVPDLSLGIYRLPAGGVDAQSPHTEDEAYYVVSGRGSVQVAGEDRRVRAGSIVHVGKKVQHKFHSIEEDLTLLVFFAPAEHSVAPKGD
jgi:mannose-6-phosphate isomerase-like protein (cupin superfamily)